MPETVHSTRFGTLEVPEEHVLEFTRGLIGIPGRRYALLQHDDEGVFLWLQSCEDPDFALPVTDAWRFFADFAVEVPDHDAAALGLEDVDEARVLVTIRGCGSLTDFTANLRAPIVVVGRLAQQVLNEDPQAPLRAPLVPPSTGVRRAA